MTRPARDFIDAAQHTGARAFAGRFRGAGLHLTFKVYKFKIMNVSDMIPASERAAGLMRSLSHPQRLLVLCALGDAEKSVAELRRALGIEPVPMSQQLMRLRADGLVASRREGTTMYYRIARPEVLTVVAALHAAFCAADGRSASAAAAPAAQPTPPARPRSARPTR